VNFPDEVILGDTLCKVYNTPPPSCDENDAPHIDKEAIRTIIERSEPGYLSPQNVMALLDAAGISRAGEAVVDNLEDALIKAGQLGFPVVMKVVGPVHKSDVGGVVLNIKDKSRVIVEFERMMKIPETDAILIQPMLAGTELFVGAKFEPGFGHIVLCGLGGIFIEVLKDVQAFLAPVSMNEAYEMIRSLKSYKIIQGVRGQAGIDENLFAEIIVRLSALVSAAPEIVELDLNPLLGNEQRVTAVDARIRL